MTHQTPKFLFAPVELSDEFPLSMSPFYINNAHIDFMHIHNTFEIAYCVKGSGVFVIENKVYRFTSDDLFLINNLEFHRAYHPDSSGSHWNFLNANTAKLLAATTRNPLLLDTSRFSGCTFCNHFPSSRSQGFQKIIIDIIYELEHKQESYQELCKALFLEFMIKLTREVQPAEMKTADTTMRSVSLMERLSPAINLITDNYKKEITIAELAKSCFLSETQFRRLFLKAFGISPLDYINDYRISMAASSLIASRETISEIAANCGFSTLSSFNRQFLARKSCSPTEFRNKHK